MIVGITLLLGVIAGSVFFATYCNEPFEKTIPISLIWISFILLIAGVFEALLIGLYFIFVLSGVLYVSVIVYAIRHGIVSTCKRIFTGTFFIFVIYFFAILYANRGMIPHDWDEFTYWIMAVKSLCLNDALYTRTHEEMMSGYPQGIAAFQYFFARSVMLVRKTDIFPAGAAYVALNLLQVSFVFPLIRKEYLKGIIMWVITIVSVFCFPIFFFSNAYSILVPDALLGMAVGAGMATVVLTPRNEKGIFYNVLIISECAFLVLAKRTGFLLAAALAGAYLLDVVYTNYGDIKKKWKEILLSVVGVGVAILFPYIAFVLETRQDDKVRAGLYSVPDVVQSFYSRTDGIEKRVSVIKSFFEQFIYESFDFGHTGGHIPFYLLILVAAVLLYAIYLLYEKYNIDQKKYIIIFGVYSFIVFGAWISVFLYSYLFKLSDIESGVLNSFGRYLTTGFMPIAYIVLFGFLSLIAVFSGRQKRIVSLLLVVVLCTVIPVGEFLRFINGRYVEEAVESRKKIEYVIGLLADTDFDSDDRVFYISQSDYGNRRNQICYYAYPTSVCGGPWCFTDGKYDSEDDYQENKMLFGSTKNAQELKATWDREKITYVLVHDIDDYFVDTFSSLFEDGVPEENTLYKYDDSRGQLVKAE